MKTLPKRHLAKEPASASSMAASLRRLYSLLTPKDRRNGAILLCMMGVTAILDLIGVAAVPLFVATLVDPEQLDRFPWLAGALEARGLDDGSLRLILFGAGVLVAVFLAKAIAQVTFGWFQTHYVSHRRAELAGRLIRAYLGAPYAFHLRRNTAELLRNVEKETAVIAYQVMNAVLRMMSRLLNLAAVTIPLLIIEPLLTGTFFGIFGVAAVVTLRFLSKKMRSWGLREQKERAGVTMAMMQGMGSLKEARIGAKEDYFAHRVYRSVWVISRSVALKKLTADIMPTLTEVIGILGLVGLILFLIGFGQQPDEIIVTLSLFAIVMVRMREAFGVLMGHYTSVRYNIMAVDPIYDDLTMLEALPPPPDAPRLPLREELVLDHISYRYEGSDRKALDDITVRVPAGSAIGLVGATGAGKSTVVDILLGLLTPTEGRVLVDGKDVQAHGLRGWQKSLGYVPQTIYLLDDTVRRNIALGVEDSKIDEERLMAAVRTAQLEGFLSRQTDGLDTVIGEGGARVSGGERQRIGIARALYDDPEVLVLDEATSALDNATEAAITQGIEAMRGERTLIIIAHRLTTVRRCDRLYFLKDGKVEAEGDFESLRQKHRDFAEMSAV
ncbi:ABC transporter ATP-binding protein [Parvularcula oceani]|uniref:ABC transporter ATP-binding protein n=1 Tax=Parvularcula oceani TaxID=1247963 RepID=UPI0012DDEE8E|nr:ABC transporter ATP-binding protein [Parvularcula oceani]